MKPRSYATPAAFRLYPVETHVTEKLHAYTLPRQAPSTRVKDLPDLALLGQAGDRDGARMRAGIRQTFSYRGTHAAPTRLPDPPASWERPYGEMAEEDSLPWPTLAVATAAARAFLDPVLGEDGDALWSASEWAWRRAK